MIYLRADTLVKLIYCPMPLAPIPVTNAHAVIRTASTIVSKWHRAAFAEIINRVRL